MARKGATRNKHANNRETSRSEPRDGSPRVVKFFKIMFAKNYWKVLYLPPLFAESVKHLEGQETEIEDLNGNRWPVEYSYVDDALAFQKGWSRFYIDHGLKIGHFVKFNYVNESHFVVEIFDESAMEVTDFNSVGPQSYKRLKLNQEIICIGDQCPRSADANLREKSSSADSVSSQSEFRDFQAQPNVIDGLISMDMDNPNQIVKVDLKPTSLDDPILLIDTRNNGCYDEGERTNMLYDLSCFEMEGKMGDTNVSEKASGKKTEQIKLKGGDTQMAAIHSGNISTRELRARPSNIGNLRKNTHNVVSSSQNGNHELRASGIEPLCVGRNKSDYAVKSKFPESSVSRSLPNSQIGPQHAVKKELVELGAQGNKFPEVHYDVSPIIAMRDGVMFLPTVKASGIEPLSVGCDKSAERDYAVKPRCAESSVSSLVPKRPLDLQLALKKELVELRAEDNLFSEGSYDKSPVIATRDGVMFLPAVNPSPGIEPLSVGRNKSAERDYALKSKFPESSVSRSLPKSSLGPQHAVRKELVELRAQDNKFPKARDGKSPIIATQNGDMFLPAVKASGIEPLSVGCNKSAERDYAVKPRCAESSVSSLVPKRPLGLQLALKKDLVELRVEGNLFSEGSNDKSSIIAMKDDKLFLPVVKAEPDLPIVTFSSSAISPFTTKVESQLYLELPVRIPPATRKKEWKLDEGKVVFLRGPNGRLIPVLYPGLFKAKTWTKTFTKTLTGNWDLFCEKNGLKPGDECRFEVEDENRCLYRVDVTRSNGW